MTTSVQQQIINIGKYEVLSHLAHGGMAVVYLAIEKGQHGLRRPVVVKQILPQHTEEVSFRRMLFQEAQIAARINHPNVVQILELGGDEGAPFIAMEYICGANLRELTRRCKEQNRVVPPAVAVALIMQACAGAHAAHELREPSGAPANLVHRDLTPHNLMVTEQGFVKVVDFGVAKASFNVEETRAGVLKGKVTYMSPEQLMQEGLDRRSDVFALGCVLWELLYGESLFKKDSEIATMHAILSGSVPDEPPADVPREIHTALTKALKQRPKKRYESADAMRLAFAKVATELGLDTSVDTVSNFVRALLGDLVEQRRLYVNDLVAQWVERVPVEVSDLTRTTEIGLSPLGDDVTIDMDVPVTVSQGGEALGSPTSVVDPHGVSLGPSMPDLDSIGTSSIVLPPRPKPEATEPFRDPLTQKAKPKKSPLSDWKLPLVGALMVLLVFGLVQWLSPPSQPVEAPAQPVETVSELAGEPIKIAIAAIFEADQHRADLEPLRVYLEAGLRRPVQMVVVSDYGATADLLSTGRVPYASLTPALYIKTHAINSEVSLVAGKEHSGTQASDAVLLARLDMEVESAVVRAEELIGKRFCYVDELSTTGYLLPRAWLMGQGLDPDTIFSKTIRSGNHMELIRNLASDVCDVGGTFEEALDRAQDNGLDVATVRRIGATGRTPHDAICSGPAADPTETQRLKELLLAFVPVENDAGSVEKLTGFWEVFDSEFDSLRKALD